MQKEAVMVSIKKVLVVDDEPEIRRLLVDVLSSPACRVVTAENGADAVEKLQRGRFSAVVTDINMPRMDGLELLRWIKKNRRKEAVVVMSGSPDYGDLSGREMPVVAARFRKPFRLPVFLDTLNTLISPKRGVSRSRSRAKGKRAN